jgi:hypothetical protein
MRAPIDDLELRFAPRAISADGSFSVLAGTQFAGYADGTGGAGFTSPFALAIDGDGNLFVTDGNAIRRVTPDGTVTTIAGSQTAGSKDGTGSAAQFDGPAGIAVGPGGAVFVSDSVNSTIRKISATGIVTTLAGVAGQAGVRLGPLPATLNVPVGLAYVGSTLYVADATENSVLAIVGVF